MNSGSAILLWMLVVVVAIVLIVKSLFRIFKKKTGVKEMIEEGVILTNKGIEFPRFIFLGRMEVPYSDIESVEFVPFPQSLTLRMRYGPSIASQINGRWLAFFRGAVVVKLKPGHLIQYRLFTPRNPLEVTKELGSRIAAKGDSSSGTQ